jgi:hypothetical protein
MNFCSGIGRGFQQNPPYSYLGVRVRFNLSELGELDLELSEMYLDLGE